MFELNKIALTSTMELVRATAIIFVWCPSENAQGKL